MVESTTSEIIKPPPSPGTMHFTPPDPASFNDLFSWNCREELNTQVECVKLFLENHVKYGTPYIPGSKTDDQCATTRNIFIKCMQYRKKHPINPTTIARDNHPAPKPCSMELNMHGSCVERQLERTQKLNQRYWTEGGEDRCAQTRANYENCMYKFDAPGNYYEGDDFKTVVHRNVKAFDFTPR